MATGICKLCDQLGPFVRSHIIPKAFHVAMAADPSRPSIITLNTGTAAPFKRMPGGFYDEELLCESCEKRFNDWDTYGAECLIQRFQQDAQPMWLNGELNHYLCGTWDESKLRMFALSVLWRCAVTSNPDWHVSLGPHESRLRDRILAGDPGSPDDFSVVFQRLYATERQNEQLTRGQIRANFRFYGVNTTCLNFGGYCIYIKCDRRPASSSTALACLKPGRPVMIGALHYESSPFPAFLMESKAELARRRSRLKQAK